MFQLQLMTYDLVLVLIDALLSKLVVMSRLESSHTFEANCQSDRGSFEKRKGKHRIYIS